MSIEKWFLLIVVIVGVLLFLYGGNYYDSVVGWVGVALFAAGAICLLILYVYSELKKGNQGQNP